MRVWVAQTMHTHVSKCKNNRIKKRKKRKRWHQSSLYYVRTLWLRTYLQAREP
jgi:hypothetical protein